MNLSMRVFSAHTSVRCILCIVLVLTCFLSLDADNNAHALDIFWRLENGGAYGNTGSWFGGNVPSNTDVAHFGVNTAPGSQLPFPYTVTFSANVTNQALVIHDDDTVFDLNTRTYATTTAAGVAVGADANRNARLTISDGILNASSVINVGAVAGGGGILTVASNGQIIGSPNLTVGNAGGGVLNVFGVVSIGSNTTTIIGNNTGVEGSATISGVGAALTTNGLIVGNAGSGVLTVGIVGTLQANNDSVMANGAGSTATASVSNSAQWLTADDLIVGNFGQATLNVSMTGVVRNLTGWVGMNPIGSGNVTIEGSALWDNTGPLNVGQAGTGTVLISNLGQVRNTVGTLGNLAGSTGTLTVTGSGSRWTNSSSATIGNLGTGTLNIQAGGLVENTFGVIGSAGNGAVNVTGANSQWNNVNTLIVGSAGDGALNITSAGRVNNTAGVIGSVAGSQSTATVAGAGSLWNNSSSLIVGSSGEGTLNISSGGRVNGLSTVVGFQANSSGHVMVDGAGSVWETAGLNIGERGTGGLEITNGGQVTSALAFVGAAAGSLGEVTVDGNGSQWNVAGSLTVGTADDGFLNITDGGVVRNTSGEIGQGAGSSSFAMVAGAGSVWENLGSLTVGGGGSGDLRITAGGVVRNTSALIGQDATSGSSVTVEGAGSRWNNSGKLIVGSLGRSTLDILNGGHVESIGGTVGEATGGDGFVVVRGAGSQWSVATQPLIIGGAGEGHLEIRDGGRVESEFAAIGGPFDSAIVEGPGATWNTENLGLDGTLTIDAGGVVNIDVQLTTLTGGGSNHLPTINLNGGTINLGSFKQSFGAVFVFNAGTFRFTDDYLIDDALLDLVLGSAHTIGPLQHLAVAGKPTMETALVLQGGTFSAGSLVPGSPLFFNSGTFNLTSDNFTIGAAGLFGDTLALASRNVNITNAATIQNGARLQLQGGAFSAGTLLNQGTIDFQDASSQVSGGLLTNTGTIRGSGSILNTIQNNAVGQIQTTDGQRLELRGAVTNSGTISLVGGQMHFNAAVANAASTGLISSRDGILRFVGGLTNHGSLVVSIGATDVFGDVAISASGRITVTGGGQATFYDDVANGGIINVSAAGPVQSTAVFLGSLSGNGVAGGGHVFIEGDARPGFSPGSMSFGGDVTLGPSASVEMEIGGTTAGSQHDQIQVVHELSLSGSLALSLINGFTPAAADIFTIISAGNLLGEFLNVAHGERLATSDGLGSFLVHYGPTSSFNPDHVVLTAFVFAGLPGDYNTNGVVDAADFTLWRDHLGSATSLPNDDTPGVGPDDYTRWKTNFGNQAGTGGLNLTGARGRGSASSNLAPIPEPASSRLLLLLTSALLAVRYRWSISRRTRSRYLGK